MERRWSGVKGMATRDRSDSCSERSELNDGVSMKKRRFPAHHFQEIAPSTLAPASPSTAIAHCHSYVNAIDYNAGQYGANDLRQEVRFTNLMVEGEE